MAEMTYGFSDIKKGVDARIQAETKKIVELRTALEKMKQQLDAERRTYCVDLKKNLIEYGSKNQIDSEQFNMIVQELAGQMDKVDKVYTQAISHIDKISITSLNVLPKKYEDYKKAIKSSDSNPSELQKIKDLEYDRIEFTKMSMVHFINAQMYVHATILEIYSNVYNQLNVINYATEFKDFDR